MLDQAVGRWTFTQYTAVPPEDNGFPLDSAENEAKVHLIFDVKKYEGFLV